METLFREESLQARQARTLGEALMISPPGSGAIATTAVILIAGLFAFLNWAEYARRVTVIGQLVPDRGLIEIPMPHAGVLVEQLVTEGAWVHEGDLMFVVAARRSSLDAEDVDLALISEIDARLKALDRLASAGHAAELSEIRLLQVQVDGHGREATAVERQVELQRTRRDALDEDIGELSRLAAAGLIPRQQIRALTDDLTLIDTTIQQLERELVGLAARALELDARRTMIIAASEREQATRESRAAELRQQSTEIRLRIGTAIRAPADGVATATVNQEGEILPQGVRLAAIIPDGAVLEARIYLPTKAAGFVALGQAVKLRYAAFPYQRFGVQLGRVRSFPAVLVPNRERTRSSAALGPVYEIRVELATQGISTSRGITRLRAGMELEADILLEHRTLIRWLLEPIEALTGSMS
jgi:membrane fusion protein